jgi:phage terminase large subunit-like protein
MAGRGFGKTRTGSEWVRQQIKTTPMVNLIGATIDDAREIMIEGESGILNICTNDERPKFVGRKLRWPNGAKSLIFTADEPDRLRGKQHMKLWADELAAWRYSDSWDQAQFGLRLGKKPQAIITTTPKPLPMLRDIIKDPATVLTRGTTYDNRANLAPAFYDKIISKYEGTRLGRQELMAEILDDLPGALWSRKVIDETRISTMPAMLRIVIAIDPAVSTSEGSDETGIIAAGKGMDGRWYVLADLSGQYSPDSWARVAVKLYHDLKADRIVAEINNGGDMVENTLRNVDINIPYTGVHATKGKAVRAEPVAALYEQKKVSHVGSFPILEDQMCIFTTDYDRKRMKYSPDRMDALVWALTDLAIVTAPGENVLDYYAMLESQGKLKK